MFNFKKISAIGTSALMIGMTAGMAAAANYPAPFVVGGNADVAVVYGTGSGVSVLDAVEAGNLQTNLQSFMGSGTSETSTSTSGETVSLDTSGTRIWLNTSLNTAKSTMTKTDLPTVLADNTFQGNVEAKMTSTLKFYAGGELGGANSSRVVFLKQPKSSDDPIIGISIGSSETSNPLYNASVTFKAVNFSHSDSEGETITLFGKDFVVSTATTATELVLFSSAEQVTLTKTSSENPTATVNVAGTDYAIELLNGDSTTATIAVDGTSKDITEGNSKKIGDIEIALKTVTSSDVAGITATLLVGSEKLTFTNDATVTKGADADPIDGTKAYLAGTVDSLTELAVTVFRPDSSNDAILPGDAFVDPVFGSFKFDFVGLSSNLDDTNRETLSVQNSADKGMSLTMTDSDGNTGTFDFAYNETYVAAQANTPVRKPAHWRLADDSNYSIFVHEGANLTEDDYTMLGNEDYGHLLQVTQIYNNTGTDYTNDRLKLQDVLSGETYTATFTAETTGTIAIDGKNYGVTILGSGDGGYAHIKYPTTDSSTTNTWVFYPTIQTANGAKVALYEPFNVTMGNINGTVATTATIINFPDGDGYTSATFTYAGMGNWTVTGAGSGLFSSNETLAANYSVLTVGEFRYNISSAGASGNYGNDTMIHLIDPEDYTNNMTEPSVMVFEEKDDKNKYHGFVINLETAPAGTSSSGVGVDDVLFTQNGEYYHASATLASDSDFTQDIDWWGTLVTTDADDSDQKTVTVSYPTNQVYAQIYIGEESASVTSSGTTSTASQLGDVLVKDTEISSVSSKNLIVVGGTCINSAAANVLGGAYCGSSFTDATGVGSGEFLVESVGDAYTTGKVALVVAGYDAADTVNAAKYLRTQTVDTTAGMKYKGTTSTSAELVVA